MQTWGTSSSTAQVQTAKTIVCRKNKFAANTNDDASQYNLLPVNVSASGHRLLTDFAGAPEGVTDVAHSMHCAVLDAALGHLIQL